MSEEPTPVRRYQFSGSLKLLITPNARYESRHEWRFCAMGKLQFIGRRTRGGTIAVNVDNEPADANHSYPALDSDEINSQENEDDYIKPDEDQRGVKKRDAYAIVVRDNGRLPLPHVGMYFWSTLERGKLLPASEIGERQVGDVNYRYYEYVVVSVWSWRASKHISNIDFYSAFSSLQHVLSADRARYAESARLAESGIRADAARRHSEATPAMFAIDNNITRDLVRLVTKVQCRRLTRLGRLCGVAEQSQTFPASVMAAFGNLYALAQWALQATLSEGATVHAVANKARLSARQVCAISMAELVALEKAFIRYEAAAPEVLLFFGAHPVIPVHALNSVIAGWQGVPLYRPNSHATHRIARILSARESTRATEDDFSLVLQLAYYLHSEQQSPPPWRRRDDVFDVVELMKAVEKRENWARRRQADGTHQSLLDSRRFAAALHTLFALHAWQRAPEACTKRLTLAARWRQPTSESMFMTTARAYALASSMAQHALFCSPQLVRTEHTGARVVMHTETLYLYCGTRLVDHVGTRHVSKRWSSTISLYDVLDQSAYTDNEALWIADMLAYRAIVVYDVHLLERHTLARMFSLFVDVKSAAAPGNLSIELHGDDALPMSLFSDLVQSNRFRVIDVAETRLGPPAPERPSGVPLKAHDEYDRVFSGTSRADDPGATLRLACNDVAHHRNAGVGRQKLVKELGAIKRLDDPAKLLLRAAKSGIPARWLLLCASSNEAIAGVFKALARDIDSVRDVEMARQFAELGERPSIVGDIVLFSSPYVGYMSQCARVHAFYTLTQPPQEHGARLASTMFLPVRQQDKPALSLDCPFLYIALDADQFGVDHQLCCQTWAPHVMCVARHRAELTGQSFILARNALPLAAASVNEVASSFTTVLLFGADYRFDDIYCAAARAAVAVQQHYRTLYFDPETLPAALTRRYPGPRSLLVDLLRVE